MVILHSAFRSALTIKPYLIVLLTSSPRLSDLSTWYVGLLTVLVDYLQHRALTCVEVVTATEDDWTLLSADDRFLVELVWSVVCSGKW